MSGSYLSEYHAVMETYSWDGSDSSDCGHGDDEEPEAEPDTIVAHREAHRNTGLLKQIFAAWLVQCADRRYRRTRTPVVTRRWNRNSIMWLLD